MKGILTDAVSGDLLVERGRIATGDTEWQTAEAVVVTMRGELKEHPLLGGEAGKLRGGCADRMWAGGSAADAAGLRGGVRACDG